MRNYIILILCIACSCKNAGRNRFANTEKWFDSSNYLIKKTYSADNVIERMQFYNKDSTPTAADITYYPNGNIRIWKWYTGCKPMCGVYYDSSGNFDTLNGRAFIDAIASKDGYFIVRTIKPPNLEAIAVLFVRDKKIKVDSLLYKISYNDSVGYFYFGKYGELTFEKDNKYTLEYYIFDSALNVVSSSNYEMEFSKDYYTFNKCPTISKGKISFKVGERE